MSDDPRITLLLTDLQTAPGLGDSDRQSLAEDLQLAQTVNGNPDPTQQLLKRVLLTQVRTHITNAKNIARIEVTQAQGLAAIAESHGRQCPVQAEAKRRRVDPEALVRSLGEDTARIKIPVLGLSLSGASARLVSAALACTVLMLAVVFARDRAFRADVLKQVRVAITEARAK